MFWYFILFEEGCEKLGREISLLVVIEEIVGKYFFLLSMS